MAAGCAEYRQISVENVALAGFRFNGTSSATIELEADVYNPTPHVIFLDEVDAVLFREGKEFASWMTSWWTAGLCSGPMPAIRRHSG